MTIRFCPNLTLTPQPETILAFRRVLNSTARILNYGLRLTFFVVTLRCRLMNEILKPVTVRLMVEKSATCR